MNNGFLVEKGNHSELIKLNGTYMQLYIKIRGLIFDNEIFKTFIQIQETTYLPK